MEPVDYIWMDGKYVEWQKANVHFLTHALHYGTGVFEGIRCYNTKKGPAIFRLDDHIKRLFDSAHILNYEIPYAQKQVKKIIHELIKINKLKECYIRPLVYLGYGKMGLNPMDCPVNFGIAAFPWPTYLGEAAIKNGVRCKVSSFLRGGVDSVLNDSKTCGNYVFSALVKEEAIRAGYDEAIMLDQNGFVNECSAENIFIIRDKKLITTPSSTVLEGLTRKSIFEIADKMKIKYKEEFFTRDQMYIADEVFLTGTAAEVTAITEIDDRLIGDGKPGPITKKLQNKFFDIVRGKDKKYYKWLSFVK